jgi:hypothetical protein
LWEVGWGRLTLGQPLLSLRVWLSHAAILEERKIVSDKAFQTSTSPRSDFEIEVWESGPGGF